MVSLGSQSRPVNLQVRSENPGSLGMGVGGNVDLHPADAALGARLFASLRALGAGGSRTRPLFTVWPGEPSGA